MMACHRIDLRTGLPIYYLGAGLEHKHLPTLIYFALSGEESLTLDPFCQPVNYLPKEKMHIFSFTLPAHGEGWDNKQAISHWVSAIVAGKDIIGEFIARSLGNIDYLIEHDYIKPGALGVAGLSRGAFMATHLAAADERIGYLLGFAPLTRLDFAEEFALYRDHPEVRALSLIHLAEKMGDKHIRYYIGNRDERVGTRACFETVEAFAESAYKIGKRSPKVDLIIGPSVGHKGHGTLPHIFKDGALWINQFLR